MPPRLGLALRTTGTGLLLWLTDLERITFVPPRSLASDARASDLVVVNRAAALAELADDDTESQLDTDVLANDCFSCEELPPWDFLTINWQHDNQNKSIKMTRH